METLIKVRGTKSVRTKKLGGTESKSGQNQVQRERKDAGQFKKAQTTLHFEGQARRETKGGVAYNEKNFQTQVGGRVTVQKRGVKKTGNL